MVFFDKFISIMSSCINILFCGVGVSIVSNFNILRFDLVMGFLVSMIFLFDSRRGALLRFFTIHESTYL